ncbi:MAG: thiazole biosynthesis protein [Candidatus Omnitrophica bacterium]|nr:thiazole biosynthesis protein [Candidatus Omnitrophota bacterium]
MKLNDLTISKAIIEEYRKKLLDSLSVDVCIVGGGPAGMMASYMIAKAGYKVNLYERKLSLGGGMWGGGMMFNKIVLQEESKAILDAFNVKLTEYEKGYYVADSIATVGALAYNASNAGVNVFNLISVEDLKVNRANEVEGAVINWSSVGLANLHVDPITVGSKFLIDATGHACEVANIILKRIGKVLYTDNNEIMGEGSMNADRAESVIVGNTKEIYKNVYAAGMSANAIFGTNRMGPIFGGMLLSGKKAAELIIDRLGARTESLTVNQ